MSWWRRLFRKPEPVRVAIRNVRPLAWQGDCDELVELQWRARVQANIRKREAYRQHGLRVVK